MSEKSTEKFKSFSGAGTFSVNGKVLSHDDLQIMSRRLMGSMSPAQQAAMHYLQIVVPFDRTECLEFRGVPSTQEMIRRLRATLADVTLVHATWMDAIRRRTFTGRSNPARRAMAKLAARRCR